MDGFTIGEYHTWKNWGLILSSVHLSPPVVKTKIIQIQGGNGRIDLSETLNGGIKYDNRMLTLELKMEDGSYNKMFLKSSEIYNAIHGKMCKITSDEDCSFYYLGRCSVSPIKENSMVSSVEIIADVDPYKYEITDSAEEWLWDEFDFETGVVREYMDIPVNGTTKVSIIGSPMPIVPTIIADAEMQLFYESKTYIIKVGEQKIYDITVTNGEHEMIFTGTGKVTVRIRGGSL